MSKKEEENNNHSRKPIVLKQGCGTKVMEELNISRPTLIEALTYKRDTELQESIRDYVMKQGYVKRF